MNRISLKVVGAQGQGINSVGEICAKGLKRGGYCVFGYREYMSLIKGGHSSYQLDISPTEIRTTEEKIDILICFNHHGLEKNAHEVKDGGLILHETADWKFSPAEQKSIEKRKVTVLYLPTDEILAKLKAKPILGNVLITSVVWALLGQEKANLQDLVREQFGHKGEKVLAENFACIDAGFEYRAKQSAIKHLTLPKADKNWSKHLLITGSEAMGLGLIHAGCRFYAGYPMTPSSPLLTFIADLQNETGMVVKQAEDEITAAQMVSGAMMMGTRAITATSGGGFDLMSETLSLNGILENPTVFVLAQRPGPATGLPTWTAQGDLLLAVNTAHGEFTRCVLSVSDSQDCFDLMPTAFNLAEEYQISVIVLTEKQIAEALYTQTPFDQKKAKLSRGKLITDPKALKKLKPADRYDLSAKDGISPRWLPGSEAATFAAQGDEHDPSGTVDETGPNTKAQFDKRLRKMNALKKTLPEPTLHQVESGKWKVESNDEKLDLLLVGWGSTKGPVLDVLETLIAQDPRLKAAYLHFTYLWPLKTELFSKLHAKVKKTVLIEGNAQGQLGMLLAQECGVMIKEKILKYDGRPFFYNELLETIRNKIRETR
ncbi:2-oxoacid:acceptor oxidoreductase subunit alpha [Candidatus Peregrinibacteria bacterium]|nr:2-oxoacid:acceptor oxidoreductase subunit alpha [Candidatus Peregrinibacteria bacterium]